MTRDHPMDDPCASPGCHTDPTTGWCQWCWEARLEDIAEDRMEKEREQLEQLGLLPDWLTNDPPRPADPGTDTF